VVETKGPTGPPHGPAPSLWPLGFAIGVTVALVGLVIGSWSAVAVGAVVLIAFGFIWARDVATGFGEPPPVAAAEPVSPGTDRAIGISPVRPGEDALPVMEEEEEIERYSRDTFLSLSTLGLGGLITGIVAVPVTVFAVVPAFVGQDQEEVDIGPIDQFPEGEFVIATFLSKPEEGEVSRRTAYVRNNGGASFTILSNRCVHLGCPVQVNGLPLDEEKQTLRRAGQPPVDLTPTQAASGFGCPCHGGQYDVEGNRTAGPPVRALDRYRYKLSDGRLVLISTYSVGDVEGEGAEARIRAYDPVDPSVHVDGPEQLLYPLNTPR
jgi:Rieske Fe-S protein